MSPHSMSKIVGHGQVVLKLFTVATSAGGALRANHDTEHHL